jgi:hypothetical protein
MTTNSPGAVAILEDLISDKPDHLAMIKLEGRV